MNKNSIKSNFKVSNRMKVNSLKSDLIVLKKSFIRIHQNQLWLIPLGILASLSAAFYPFINIYMSSLIVDKLVYRNWNELINLAIITIFLNLVFGILSSGLSHLHSIQEKMFYSKQKQIFSNKVMELDYESLESSEVHDKIRRVEDMHEITGMRLETLARISVRLSQSITKVVLAAVLVFTCFSAVSVRSADGFARFIGSTIVSLGFIFFIVMIIAVNTHLSFKHGSIYFKFEENRLPFLKLIWYYDREYLDTYRTGKEIRIFHQSSIINRSYDEAMVYEAGLCNDLGAQQGKYNGISAVTTVLSTGAIYLYVSLKALVGIFSVGSIVKYVGAITQLCEGIQNIIIDMVSLKQLLRWLRLYWDYMDTGSEKYKGSLPVKIKKDNEYEIEFRDVSFKYPGTDRYVLKNLNMKLSAGKRLAIVGMNGSGKTTMIKLLCRLYDPTEGEITLNDVNIKNYDISEYMAVFSVVFQDFKLFSFTLGQNVSASQVYNGRKVTDVLEKAGFSERLGKIENDLDTYIYNNFGEKGLEISGGEAQKIALARALYKDAPLIILDEPTAALDPIAEYEIYTRFNEIVGNKTAIYISHRLSSCRFCDDIAVFHEGKLIQRGSHDRLVADVSGKYHEL